MRQSTKKTILAVDDTLENLQLLVEILGQRGYRVRPALDGERALTTIQKEAPDLILLDITMPGMNGYEVCRRIKANAELSDIPVIFISALDQIFDKVAAFNVGGVDYITKPFHEEEVVARVETHLSLRDMRLKLEKQNQDLEAYAHTVAHDLKSPMGLVLGFTEILNDTLVDKLDETQQEWMQTVLRTTRKMANIVDELLLLASVHDMQDIPVVELDMAPIVASVQDGLRPLIAEKEAEIIIPDKWPTAMGYYPWVEEVWVNYISNALKYGGSPPKIVLGADTCPDGMIYFWVRDNGAGMSPEEQERLFKQFSRLGSTHIKGYGLGLSIVKHIVEKLGGRVGLKSTLGEGSTFSFTLPVAK